MSFVLLHSLCMLTSHRYYGIIQAGYRAVLEAMSENLSSVEAATASEATHSRETTEAPSTPSRSFSRNSSFSLSRNTESTPFTKTFQNNTFTTVSTTFIPPTPMYKIRSGRNKRERDSSEGDASPPRKK